MKYLLLALALLLMVGSVACGYARLYQEGKDRGVNYDEYSWVVHSKLTGECFTPSWRGASWSRAGHIYLAKVPCPPELSKP